MGVRGWREIIPLESYETSRPQQIRYDVIVVTYVIITVNGQFAKKEKKNI